MKTLIIYKIGIFFIFAIIAIKLNGQEIKSKDGVYIGQKEELITLFIGSSKEKYREINGAIMDAELFFGCIIENIFPNLLYSEIDSGIKTGELVGYFINDDNIAIFQACSKKAIVDITGYKFNGDTDPKILELRKENARKACVTAYLESNNDNPNIKEANIYCNCVVEKAFSSSINFSYDDIFDENSEAYNEIIIPCQKILLTSQDIIIDNYKSSDIIGSPDKIIVPLVKNINGSCNIKLNLDGVVKYFLLDTGAADIIINEDLEKILINNGTLKDSNFFDNYYYLMANNELVLAKVYTINNVNVGEYTINNVFIAVVEGASLLCGISFLEKFKSWSLNADAEQIILFK